MLNNCNNFSAKVGHFNLTRQTECNPKPVGFVSFIHLGKSPQKTFGKGGKKKTWKVTG